MPEVSLELVFAHQLRILDELRIVRAVIGNLKADREVQSAVFRRPDASVQNLTGEVRALAGQQDRQRQKPDRLDKRPDRTEAPETV